MTTNTRGDELRAWAKGSYPTEAAVELLIRAFRGRFVADANPWVKGPADSGLGVDELVDPGPGRRYRLDVDAMTDNAIAGLSAEDRRLLRIARARSLAGGEPVNLNDDIPGLDRDVVQLVPAAIAHAAGSHEDSGIVYDAVNQPAGFERLDTRYPWPDGR